LTVMENFKFVSYLYDIKNRKRRIDEILERFEIQNLVNKQISELSEGQKTKVNLAKAFLNFPKVLLLDEPTASMDPASARFVREFLIREREKFNISIIFTSHNMAEVEEVSDRIIFINRGKIIANDTPLGLAKTIKMSNLKLFISKGLPAAKKYCDEKGYKWKKKTKFFVIAASEVDIAKILQDLVKLGTEFEEISISSPTLEDYFLEKAVI